jgi:hypothetical protein
MDNYDNQNEALGSRVYDILLKMRYSGSFSDSEIRDLCYATGISINWPKANSEPVDQRLRRIQDLIEVELRG